MTKTEYDLQVFENNEFGKLQTFIQGNKVYFIAKQVIELLGYAKYRNALDRFVDDEDRICIIKSQISNNPVSGLLEIPNRGLTCINESGLYSLILSSKLESAKKFKRWVTSEVLPMIRKTGGYVNNEEQFINTYLPNADEATRLMFKTHLATIKNLNDKVGELNNKVDELTTNNTKLETINTELTVTNAALTEQINTWDKRKCLNALVRSYGAKVFNGDIKGTWKEIYRQLNYYLGINVWNRQKNKNVESRLDTLNEDEIAKTVKMVSALCEQHGMNVGRIIGITNKNIIDNIPAINAIAIC